jgi:streptomycin 6-kinase
VPVKIPKKLVALCQDNAERLRWLNRLPEVLDSLQQRWSLKLEDPFDSDEVSCAWVATAALEDGTTAVLKLGMPHMEAEHEIEGLRFWAGNPTVHLLAADVELGAMLLEQCEPGTALRGLPETEQDIVIASLLRRLWRSPPAPHPFRPLAAMTADWSDKALAQTEHWRDPSVVSEGLYLFKTLPETASAQALLATDLHAGNVLRAQREQWLAIDPKPFVGDPAYDATQHLLNCYGRLRSKPLETIRRFADLLNLDYERIRLWTFARAAVQAGDDWQNDRWIELAQAIGRS